MKVSVNREACRDTALCTGLAPEVFELNEQGRLVVLVETPSPDQLDDVLQAVHSCPLQALSVTDD
ncbi:MULTISPECIES: ferredoxin [Streptomyces]|uniref:Ferredoxin n=2 Tax=Streptomyces rhizosphaericus TaxID=114699 RepID=A0ABN1SQ44_9ACTN|nr:MULTISPECIES: ferredoxin [Streptomyces]MCG0285249.1 ferredoxin [Streptomyces sp. PSAA01]